MEQIFRFTRAGHYEGATGAGITVHVAPADVLAPAGEYAGEGVEVLPAAEAPAEEPAKTRRSK